MKIKLIVLILCSALNLFSQTESVKWGKADISYAKKIESQRRDYSISTESISQLVLKPFISAYWFFISDLDGDNCPFRPSCSKFLIEAIEVTNLPQGILMFFDRFTRDMNIFDRPDKYPRFDDFHYYDPVTLYTLDEQKINYIPPFTRTNTE